MKQMLNLTLTILQLAHQSAACCRSASQLDAVRVPPSCVCQWWRLPRLSGRLDGRHRRCLLRRKAAHIYKVYWSRDRLVDYELQVYIL